MTTPDVVVVGAGPAGMAAAERIAAHGVRVLVVGEQPDPGGQIWRGIARNSGLCAADPVGAEAIARFRASGAQFLPETRMWQLQPAGDDADGWSVFLAGRGRAWWRNCRAVVLATGAMERPVPSPGWTLPGVMTVGAAQILLKTSKQVPHDPVWIAGSASERGGISKVFQPTAVLTP